jgi:hypothetical protein
MGVLKSTREKKQDLVATGILVGPASETVSELIAGGLKIAADNPY